MKLKKKKREENNFNKKNIIEEILKTCRAEVHYTRDAR